MALDEAGRHRATGPRPRGQRPRAGRTLLRALAPAERPRERLLAHGAATLSDAELVAVLLRTGTRERGVLELARALLAQLGGLAGLARSDSTETATLFGIGPAKAATLAAALELGARLAASSGSEVRERPAAGRAARDRPRAIRNGEDVYRLLRPRLVHRRQEVFVALLLDARHRPLRVQLVSQGTLTEAPVHPREAFAPALRQGAAAVIFAHNHPSGDPSPSAGDIALTRRLLAAGTLLGIPVLDHVIVAREGYTSLVLPGAAARAASGGGPPVPSH